MLFSFTRTVDLKNSGLLTDFAGCPFICPEVIIGITGAMIAASVAVLINFLRSIFYLMFILNAQA
jgi:hypothetical protein